MIVRQGMKLTVMGLAIGLASSVALVYFVSSLLVGVSLTNWTAFAGVSLLLALVAFVACWIPARRATKVDPMIALRYE